MAECDRDVVRDALISAQGYCQFGCSKVSVVGCGNLGTAIAYALCLQDLCSDVVLYDGDDEQLTSEVMDLQVPAACGSTRIHGSTDLAHTADSRLCVLTATARQRPGAGKQQLLRRNMAVLRGLVPALASYSPLCVMLVVTNPVEPLTYLTWKLSNFPARRVIGVGTHLDSTRLRFAIAKALRVHPSSVQATVFGEHGDQQIADLPAASVAGVRPAELDGEASQGFHSFAQVAVRDVKDSARRIVCSKGFTQWGVAMSVAAICSAVLNDTREVLTVTVCAEGCKHAEGLDVFVSLPAALCLHGVHAVMKPHLPPQLQRSLCDVPPQLLAAQRLVDQFLAAARV
ncbi:L-lactate dehydrogenase-like [Bacillus rossius redtenbacheri]|uniref:L-lactate dehydrogenase-like n=1 Tax=Bacillus rossius redtenbacheri TaxID=93214 RepID=UPI002FDE11D8